MKNLKVTIVIPCHNEAQNVEVLATAILKMDLWKLYSVEVIFVDDGSKDATYEQITAVSLRDSRCKGIALSRNFGHQIALLAGLEQAKGDVIITMDGDMQHPPSMIPKLIEKFEEGYDIVNTKRIDANSTSFLKKKTSKYFYILINKLSDIRVEPFSADFRLMSRETVDAFLQIKEQDRFTRGLVSWIGFNQTIVSYKANPRLSGRSSYTLKKMMKLAISGITSMSSKPLRISLYLGLFFFLGGIVYALFILYTYFNGYNVQGWTSILITILILGGLQLLMLSIIGAYVSRIFNESKSRPLYLIKKRTYNN